MYILTDNGIVFQLKHTHCTVRHALVLFPDPALKEGKGLIYIECFLGLDDVSVRNSGTSSDSRHVIYI